MNLGFPLFDSEDQRDSARNEFDVVEVELEEGRRRFGIKFEKVDPSEVGFLRLSATEPILKISIFDIDGVISRMQALKDKDPLKYELLSIDETAPDFYANLSIFGIARPDYKLFYSGFNLHAPLGGTLEQHIRAVELMALFSQCKDHINFYTGGLHFRLNYDRANDSRYWLVVNVTGGDVDQYNQFQGKLERWTLFKSDNPDTVINPNFN